MTINHATNNLHSFTWSLTIFISSLVFYPTQSHIYYKPTSQYWANTTTLMRFELWLTLLFLLVLSQTWNIGYMLGRVSRDNQRAWNIHSGLKIVNLALSQYTIAITLILWLLKCVNFVFNVCSLKHDLRINLIFTQKLVNKCRNTPAKLFCSKPFH